MIMKKYFFPVSFFIHLLQQHNQAQYCIYLCDDLGYGTWVYGATKLLTPNIDALAKKGLLFTNGHATSSTCTPSRYSLMTGTYAWRKKGTGILPGDAA
jgi:arylsulfatase A-like enzyme